MRKTFQIWLFFFMTAAFIIVFSISFLVQTRQASDNAKRLIFLKIEDVIKQLEINNANLKKIRRESDRNAIAKARAFAHLLALKPDMVHDYNALDEIRHVLDVDELHISNAKGILIAGTVKAYYGYDFASDLQSAAFLPAITRKDFVLAQNPQPKGYDKKIFQYIGVSRTDQPGIVQIGYVPEKLQQAMDVADIKNLAQGFRVGNSGSALVADGKGKIVSIADSKYLGKSLADFGFKTESFQRNTGGFIADISGRKELCAFKKYHQYLIIGTLPADEMYLSRNSTIVVLIVFNVLLFGIIFLLIAKLVQDVVISGIYKINGSLAKITQGELNEIVNVRNNKEFVSLSDGINATVAALKTAIKEAAARIDNEMAFAKAIQLSSLPSKFPAFPDRPEFDIYAEMHTAKEVGGDFYDFFLIDGRKLCFLVADVSGKGIPAALFMMIAKTIIKNLGLSGLPVDEILYRANNTLCENNETNMFVTLFVGILDFTTCKLSCSNAGHNPPLIRRAGGTFEWLPGKNGFVLAGLENTRYTTQEFTLAKGDRLFLYTDGVTEAMNTRQELYSGSRLMETLNREPAPADLIGLLTGVKADLDRFIAGAEQADDITMLGVEMR